MGRPARVPEMPGGEVELPDDEAPSEVLSPRQFGEDDASSAEFADLDLRRHRPTRERALRPQVSRSPDDAAAGDSLVARYFGDLGHHTTFETAEAEYGAARAIELAEVEHWVTLLSFLPAAVAILRELEQQIEACSEDVKAPQLPTLLALAERGPLSPDQHATWAELAADFGCALRMPDADRLWMTRAAAVARGVLRLRPDHPVHRRYLDAVERTRAAADRAKGAFVRANLRLVVSISRRYNRGRMPLIDLIQEGNLGLIKAVERFDHARSYRFSTFSAWWIRHAISRSIADKARAVRIPVHMLDTYNRVVRAMQKLLTRLGREPTLEELHAETEIPREKLERVVDFHIETPLSLDRPVGDEDGRKYLDFLQDDDAVAAPDAIDQRRWAEELPKLISKLPPIQRRVLRERFGLDDEDEHTLQEVGEGMGGLSRERVRQLEEEALGKLRQMMAEQGIGLGV